MSTIRITIWLAIYCAIVAGCSNTTNIGADLLSQDQEDVFFTDTLSIQSELFFQDSVLTYTAGVPVSSLPFGTYEDPIFGTNSSDFFFQITTGSLSFPVLNDFTIDSIYLVFELDSAASYGTLNNPMDFELLEMLEPFDPDTSYYTDNAFQPELESIVSGSFTPDLFIDDILPLVGNDTLEGKMVQIPIPLEWGSKLLDTSFITNFDDEFNGLYMKNTSAASSEGMLVFDPSSQRNITSINIFYTDIADDDTSNYVYRYFISPTDVKVLNLSNDVTGTAIETAQNSSSQEYWYTQGLEGPETIFSFPNLSDLGNILVNSAFLELTVAKLPEDNLSVYTPASQLICTYVNEDGRFASIDDVGQGVAVFGGTYTEDITIASEVAGTYRLNLSNYFQKLVDGTVPAELHLQVTPKVINPARSIIYGTESAYRPKLELTYTRINP